MDRIHSLTEKIHRQTQSSYEDFPDIQLYMDQVLEYLAREELFFKEGDKLTSAMINNYIKDGLLPRANGKKYSREHLVYLSIIASLKQVLSVKDTGVLVKEEIENGKEKEYYDTFLRMLNESFQGVLQTLKEYEKEGISSLAMHLAVNSYVNKIACEYLIDGMLKDNQSENFQEENRKKKKAQKK